MQDDLTKRVDAWQRQLRKGVLEVAVLGLLRQRPRYGLELVVCLEPLGISSGSIYPLLARIRREGKAQSEWISEGGGRPRKYYSLTPEGHRTCEAQLRAWVLFRDAFESIVEEQDDESGTASHG
ncbi:MAG TPA: PadR family transcriptional regulator [Deltaproteobacteria bacterium]|nr:PadR family transcriptional regulator [Deltaproteobacteria bacterium]